MNCKSCWLRPATIQGYCSRCAVGEPKKPEEPWVPIGKGGKTPVPVVGWDEDDGWEKSYASYSAAAREWAHTDRVATCIKRACIKGTMAFGLRWRHA